MTWGERLALGAIAGTLLCVYILLRPADRFATCKAAGGQVTRECAVHRLCHERQCVDESDCIDLCTPPTEQQP